MKRITFEIPDGKSAEWIDGVLTLVDETPKDITERIKTFEDACKWCTENGHHNIRREYDCIVTDTLILDEVSPDLIAYLKLRIIVNTYHTVNNNSMGKTIGLISVDSKYPNLALMKIATYHKQQGNRVLWYDWFEDFDDVYMSKVFSFTPDYGYVMPNVRGEIYRGGTGYDITSTLPVEIDMCQPDYSIYPNIDPLQSYGFLTRGCPNQCKWCVVPKKEGGIKPYMDIDDITMNGSRPHAILMDNNVLASEYGLEQIEKIINRKYRVDFNQGLDARLITDDVAKLLAKVKWIKRIRLACDTPMQIKECEKAISFIRSHGYNGEFFIYCIIMDFEESFNRINHWRIDKKVIPFAQPYRDPNNPSQQIPQWQKDMARWVNEKAVFKTTEFRDYVPRKGFTCAEYFI